ncbi:synaptonemal complex protein 3-like [Onychomys torridus]|uniref:synaptonemal complex protein 3-like n=1 Tax=Onychomys torridus TaxID=38674 RepID=UPI00167FDD55|nr:synaptonemal complex protein 3-like [Onychomys torridus]
MENIKHIAIYHYDIDNEKEEVVEVVEKVDDGLDNSADSSPTEKNPVFGNPKKIWVPTRKDDDTGNEVKNKMENIGADVSNAVTEKKKRMELYIKGVVKDCNKNIKQHLKFHEDELREFKIEFTEKIITVFPQWDLDIKHLGDQEDKLTDIFDQQKNIFEETKMCQNQGLKRLTQENKEFLKALKDLENGDLLTSVRSEIKNQMSLLQKKIADS